MYVLDRPIATAAVVKQALEALDRPMALVTNPLTHLPVMPEGGAAPAELRGLLVDVIFELADSRSAREAESGRLLANYYIKKVGGHEAIMERLHLSRPTYFRRLRHGYALVALQLNRVSDFAVWFQL